jgi:dienelactone hydrolase
MMRTIGRSGAVLALAASAYGQQGQAPAGSKPTSKRPATIDDLVSEVSNPTEIAVSPDSAWVAVPIARSATPGERYRDGYTLDQTDIWIFSSDGRVRRNLTLGKTDGSGWWEPVWSPDGKRLAMLSTRGSDGSTRLYVWDRVHDRIALATDRAVSPKLAIQLPRYQRGEYCDWLRASFAQYAWVSDTTVVFLALPRGTVAEWHTLTELPRTAERAWALAERGTAPTASVLDAGPGVPPESFAPLELTQVDVTTRLNATLAPVPMGDYRAVSAFGSSYPAAGTISPDGHSLALMVVAPMAEWPVSWQTKGCCYIPGFRLGLIGLNSGQPIRWVTLDSTGFFGTDHEVGGLATNMINCGPPRARWASDGGSVLVHVSRAAASEDHWYRVAASGLTSLALTDAPPRTAADTAHPPPLMLAVQRGHGFSDRYDLVLHGRDTVMTLNASGSVIDPGRKIVIPYRGADGDSLIAVLQLPVGYVAGQRYPMITTVYHGDVQHAGDTVPSMDDALWAAHGYLVLYPSMPARGGGHGVSDALVDLTKGVFPAIDRAVELGYADAHRLGVRGGSFGGFTTYALIAYSDRFKAAIAECGPTDFVSYYGTFTAPFRYRDGLGYHGDGATPDQAQLDGPPWAELERYIRNSPLTYADRIHTPVMIVHGDLDEGVPIQQSEEMFTALRQLGQRVQFVRYWGEGHWLVSPANIRDRWEREIKWFDTYLKLQTQSTDR